MYYIKRTFILSVIFLTSTQVFASEQGLYYRLHQATRLLEQYSHCQCQDHYNMIKNQLIKADTELGKIILKSSKKSKTSSVFENDLQELWKLYNHRSTLKPDQIEAYRFQIHVKAESAHLKHQESWYKESSLCGSKNNL